jgi:hypothetical protein
MMQVRTKHPGDMNIADYLGGAMKGKERDEMVRHLADCRICLEKAVAAHDSVEDFRKNMQPKKRKGFSVKNINIYLVLAIISFALSFAAPRYFLQFLVATLLLGIKWVVDSKTTRTLIMIQEAWRRGGEKEASQILETLNNRRNNDALK